VSVVRTVNPATGDELAQYPTHSDAGIDAVLDAAVQAQVVWAARSIEERSAVLRRAAVLLRDDVGPLSRLVTREMGKPLAEAAAEVEKCATACDYYADDADRILAEEVVETSADRSWISYEPVGVVLAVMPWNFPCGRWSGSPPPPSWPAMPPCSSTPPTPPAARWQCRTC
jgi:succinate-semialdehyde dehydrogenase / glutarate-semialdehyde dehydrogenase